MSKRHESSSIAGSSAHQPPADEHAQGAVVQPQPLGVPSGAPPSNTASDKGNGTGGVFFQPLRWGVDSLYLSYKGNVHAMVEAELKKLKALAQSQNPLDVGRAQYRLGEHIFQVKDKGGGLFPYILVDPSFRLQIPSWQSQALPLAYVKVSSGFLAAMGMGQTKDHLYPVVEPLGNIEGPPRVGRIDLFVDFVTGCDLESWGREAWVTRASTVNNYSVDGRFSGWAIGVGGAIAARLDDKTLEIKTSGKYYLEELWRKAGWDGEARVWRLEVQLKREVLFQLGLNDFDTVMSHLNGIWGYALTEWLKLAIPNPNDHKRSRWPIHPLWAALASVDWETPGGPLLREYPKDHAPSDEWLFIAGLRPIIAFMAKTEITDFDVALPEFQSRLLAYHEDLALRLGLRFVTYVREKVQLKAREYSTFYNDDKFPDEDRKRAELNADAEEYRRQSDGG